MGSPQRPHLTPSICQRLIPLHACQDLTGAGCRAKRCGRRLANQAHPAGKGDCLISIRDAHAQIESSQKAPDLPI